MPAAIIATSALSVGPGGVEWEKAPDALLRPASTIKGLTLYVARQWVTDAMLSDTVTITDADMTTGSSANLRVGDVVSWDDLFHALMLPSGNDAARAVGRAVGQMILDAEQGTGDPRLRFMDEMRDAATDFGWEGTVIGSTAGYPDSTSRMTCRQLCELYAAFDDYSLAVCGEQAHAITVTGPNARVYTVEHTVRRADGAVPFPEMVGAKSGSLGASVGAMANVVMMWDDHHGGRHVTALLGSWPLDQRYVDLRAVMDDVIATLPPPDPDPEPTGPTLRFTDGRPVALRRTDGTPIAL